jgi:hypothetical protein
MKLFKSAQQNVKKIFRSRSPAVSDHQLDRQADRSSAPTHAPTSDKSASQSTSGAPTTFVGTQAGTLVDDKDDKKPVPTPPSKRFVEVKTAKAQHDLVVLHVAYILQKSSNLQSLVLEVVRLSKMHGVREFSRCSFA